MIDPKYRKKFKRNIIKLSIGIFLFSVSYLYTLVHPAPKVSMEYGLRQLSQRVMLFWYKIKNEDSTFLKEKYSYEDVYQDLLTTAKQSSCVSPVLADAIEQKSIALKQEPNKNLEQNLPSYIYKVSLYEDSLKKCKAN